MAMCFVPECKHYTQRYACRFFTFPKDIDEKNRWIQMRRRTDREPNRYSLVCSCHFPGGQRQNGPTKYVTSTSSSPKFSPLKYYSPKLTPKTVTRGEKKKKINFPQERAAVKKKLFSTSFSTKRTSSESSAPEFFAEQADEILSLTDSVSLTKQLSMLNVASTSSTSISQQSFAVMYESGNYFLSQELISIKKELENLKEKFSWKYIENDNKKILLYTGLPSKEIFLIVFNFISKFILKYYCSWNVVNVSQIDQMLM